MSLAASALTACGGTEGQRIPNQASTLKDIKINPSAPDADTYDIGADIVFDDGNLPDIPTPATKAPNITTSAAKLFTAPEQVTYSGPSVNAPPEVNQAYSENHLSEPKNLARFANLSGITGNGIIHRGGGDDVFTCMDGSDTVLITCSMGRDTVLDFSELQGGKIQFAESALDLSHSESEIGFVISLDVDNSLTVTYS